MEESDSSLGYDYVDIKFIEIEVCIRKLWSFEIEIKVRYYSKEVNKSQSQIVNSDSWQCNPVIIATRR